MSPTSLADKEGVMKRPIRAQIVMTICLLSALSLPAVALPSAVAANSCPDGGSPLPGAGSDRLADGGRIDHFQSDDGTVDVPVAPNGFDPLTASADDLDTYGLPPRPEDPDSLADWTAQMTQWPRTPDAGLCEESVVNRAAMGHHASSSGAIFTIENSSNWAGYSVSTPGTTTYIAVQGDFHQPTRGASCSGAQESSWTGIGGFNDTTGHPLMQTGTAITDTGTYYAWYEYLNDSHQNPPVTMQSVKVHPADRIHTYVVHQRSTGKTTFYVADNTSGTSQSVIVSLASSYYDGTSAEMIDERPFNPIIGLLPLVNFDQISWTNAQIQKTSGTWYTLGSQSEIEIDMRTSSIHYLAFPYSLDTSTTFRDNYFNCS
jgi:hypothetical protein